jgi:hypothetical protein
VLIVLYISSALPSCTFDAHQTGQSEVGAGFEEIEEIDVGNSSMRSRKSPAEPKLPVQQLSILGEFVCSMEDE